MKTTHMNTTEKHARAFWVLQGGTALLQLLQLLVALYSLYITLP
jgi:hypothetical protein